ncbi:MAG: hypothetical protein U0271_35470 [Polyangiaceae bacterium]
MRYIGVLAAVALGSISVLGCGAKVVYVEGGEGGAGSEQSLSDACELNCQKTVACVGEGCEAACPSLVDSAQATGCAAELEAMLDCFNELPDACNPPPDACIDPVQNYVLCFGGFCAQHPDDPNCGFGV